MLYESIRIKAISSWIHIDNTLFMRKFIEAFGFFVGNQNLCFDHLFSRLSTIVNTVQSAMLIRDGYPGGRILGATNDLLVGKATNLQTGLEDENGSIPTSDFVLAGIVEGFGIDTQPFYPNSTSFKAIFSS